MKNLKAEMESLSFFKRTCITVILVYFTVILGIIMFCCHDNEVKLNITLHTKG